jgi:hypothetical protein
VSTGSSTQGYGASYSLDGGHTWQIFNGLEGIQPLATDWISDRCGWIGTFTNYSGSKGFCKFGGVLPGTSFQAPSNLKVTGSGRNTHLAWNAPQGGISPNGYNVYRNGQLLTPVPVTRLDFDDPDLQDASYRYCISAVYEGGESTQICLAIIISSIEDQPATGEITIFPNPAAGGLINISCGSMIESVRIYSPSGLLIYENRHPGPHLSVGTAGFQPGIYLVQATTKGNTSVQKIVVR